MTNLTKRAMADALKQLLQKHSLDHITIQDVTDAAQVSRKTFYYHFHDIYDLVEWLLVEDCKILTQNHTDSGIWVRDVAIALNYATENRGWLLSIYQSMERPQLEGILRKIVGPLTLRRPWETAPSMRRTADLCWTSSPTGSPACF